MESIAVKLAFIGAAGIAAQWVAWRLRLPAIALLLAAGFIAGPVTGFIEPARDFAPDMCCGKVRKHPTSHAGRCLRAQTHAVEEAPALRRGPEHGLHQ